MYINTCKMETFDLTPEITAIYVLWKLCRSKKSTAVLRPIAIAYIIDKKTHGLSLHCPFDSTRLLFRAKNSRVPEDLPVSVKTTVTLQILLSPRCG